MTVLCERTDARAVLEELQPVRRTHIREDRYKDIFLIYLQILSLTEKISAHLPLAVSVTKHFQRMSMSSQKEKELKLPFLLFFF